MHIYATHLLRCIFYGVGVLAVLSCVKTPVEEEPIPEKKPLFVIQSFDNSEEVGQEVIFELYPDSTAIGLVPLPVYNAGNEFVLTINIPDGARAYVDDIEQVSGETVQNFSQPQQYRIVYRDGVVENYQLEVYPDTKIPIFWIETAEREEVTSKEDYLDAMLKVNPGAAFEQEQLIIPTQIRGRGNSTWLADKKPYRLRFRQATEVLGLPATRNWVLLANHADKTLLRNFVGFELGNRMMEGFTPRTRFVDVYLNGAYIGNYHLTDQIRIEEARVNIDELESSDTDEAVITGGYLLEIEARLDEENWWRTARYKIPINYKNPEFPNDEQRAYIETYIQEFEEILADPTFGNGEHDYEAYIDMPSFVSWYLINEILKNNDAILWSSVFLHKPRGEKLRIGPLWDFDIAAGNINYNGNDNPEGWWIKTKAAWYTRLFKDEKFKQAVKSEWSVFKNTHYQAILDQINEKAYQTLNLSQQWNFQRWSVLDEYVWPNAVVLGSHDAEVEYLKEWLQIRVAWMDGEIATW